MLNERYIQKYMWNKGFSKQLPSYTLSLLANKIGACPLYLHQTQRTFVFSYKTITPKVQIMSLGHLKGH